MYLKTIFRHLLKHKLNFIFKLGGITIALFCLSVITIYLSFQFSFDRFHRDYKNVFRVNSIRDENAVSRHYATVPLSVGPILAESLQEVSLFTRTDLGGGLKVTFNDKQYEIVNVVGADSSLFDVLSFQFIRGDKHALVRPGSLVITESVAKTIFGDLDPIHKILVVAEEGNAAYEVTAVIADIPENSHLYAHAFRQLASQSIKQIELLSYNQG